MIANVLRRKIAIVNAAANLRFRNCKIGPLMMVFNAYKIQYVESRYSCRIEETPKPSATSAFDRESLEISRNVF